VGCRAPTLSGSQSSKRLAWRKVSRRLAALTAVALVARSPLFGVGNEAYERSEPKVGWLGFGFTRHESASRNNTTQVWLFVRNVVESGPAARAGLRVQDVITRVNGKPVAFRSDTEVVEFVEAIRPGDRVRLTVRRGTRAWRSG